MSVQQYLYFLWLLVGISGCGSSSVQNGTSGVISSMNFPIEYNNDSKCHWDINVPPGKVKIDSFDTLILSYCLLWNDFKQINLWFLQYIKLEFNKTFEVEPGEGPVCEYDRVTVYSGSGGRHFVGEYLFKSKNLWDLWHKRNSSCAFLIETGCNVA